MYSLLFDFLNQVFVTISPLLSQKSIKVKVKLEIKVKVKVKVKQSRYRPGVAERVPGS